MNLFITLIIGLLAGTHTATWGMYRDAIYEGFTYRKYSRSIILSGGIALVVQLVTNLHVTHTPNLLILYGMTYVIERAILEFYTTFLREEDQSKYFIPMQFHVGGKVVQSRRKRWLVAAACLAGVLIAFAGIDALQRVDLNLPGLVIVLLIGSVGGWISAFGGAWKDAPIEGFEILKFFRSPAIAIVYALIIACFTGNYLYIAMCGLGYTIGTIETYKKFFFHSKPPGKFAGKEIQYPEMLDKRKPFAFLFAAIWLAVITTGVIAFIQPHTGLI